MGRRQWRSKKWQESRHVKPEGERLRCPLSRSRPTRRRVVARAEECARRSDADCVLEVSRRLRSRTDTLGAQRCWAMQDKGQMRRVSMETRAMKRVPRRASRSRGRSVLVDLSPPRQRAETQPLLDARGRRPLLGVGQVGRPRAQTLASRPERPPRVDRKEAPLWISRFRRRRVPTTSQSAPSAAMREPPNRRPLRRLRPRSWAESSALRARPGDARQKWNPSWRLPRTRARSCRVPWLARRSSLLPQRGGAIQSRKTLDPLGPTGSKLTKLPAVAVIGVWFARPAPPRWRGTAGSSSRPGDPGEWERCRSGLRGQHRTALRRLGRFLARRSR